MNKKKSKTPLTVSRPATAPIFESHNRRVTTKMGHVEKIIPRDACRVLETCGSCSLLKLDYKSQILQKTLKLKERLKELGGFYSHMSVQHFVESDEKLAYRQSVKLVVSEHFVGGKPWIDIGFYRQSLDKIVDIGNCPIQSPILNDVMHYLRAALKNFQIPIYSPRRRAGILSGLILRSASSSKQTFVILLVQELKVPLFRELACEILEKFSHIQGVFLQLENHDGKAPAEPVLVAGNSTIEEKFGLLNFKLTSQVELPIHPHMTSKIYARVLELADLTANQSVLHLFGGVGALSCFMAQKCRMVYALHERESYAKNMELNLKLHKMNNVQIHAGKLEKTLPQLKMSIAQCDVAVVTAPRTGVGKKNVEQLCLFEPKHILYSSSFNDSFEEDLNYFVENNYKPVFIEPFDTHPGTPYFEVLCYLKKIAPISKQ